MTLWRWLGVAVVSYTLCHHLGSLPEGLGAAGHGTRWADWLDLAVPLLVLAPLALAVRAGGARGADWWLFGVGAVVYAQGHGIHLAGNSIGNVDPGPTAHLWDEPVGHHVWFAGLALVVVATARVLTRHPSPPGTVPWLAAAVAGVTWGTNAVGGGTEVMSLVLGLVAVLAGFRLRRSAAVLLAPAGLAAGAALIATAALT